MLDVLVYDPDHVPRIRLRLHVRGNVPHHVSEFGLHRANACRESLFRNPS